MERCTVGHHLGKACHLLVPPVITTGVIHCHELSEKDRTILQARTGAAISEESTVCFHHTHLYLSNYYTKDKDRCYNPLGRHGTRPVKTSLHVISYEDMQLLLQKGRKVICGQKVCATCWRILNNGGTERQSKGHSLKGKAGATGNHSLPNQKGRDVRVVSSQITHVTNNKELQTHTPMQKSEAEQTNNPNDASVPSLEAPGTIITKDNFDIKDSENGTDTESLSSNRSEVNLTSTSKKQNNVALPTLEMPAVNAVTIMASNGKPNLESPDIQRNSSIQSSDSSNTNVPIESVVNESELNSNDKQQLPFQEESNVPNNVTMQSSEISTLIGKDSDGDPMACSETCDADQIARPETSDTDQIARPETSDADQIAHPETSDADQIVRPETSDADQIMHPETSSVQNEDVRQGSSESNSSFGDSEMHVPVEVILKESDSVVNEPGTSGAKRTHSIGDEDSGWKRARGRPRKQIIHPASDEDAGGKRARGRPKKKMMHPTGAEDASGTRAQGKPKNKIMHPTSRQTRRANAVEKQGQETPQLEQQHHKCLMLNFRELHACYNARHPKNLTTFSAFCALRPTSCLSSKANGMTRGSLCELHENVKLMVDILPGRYVVGQDSIMMYPYLFRKLMCFNPTPLCSVGKCAKCPNFDSLKTFIVSNFDTDDYDPDDYVRFCQWVCTDETMQVELRVLTVDEFADQLCRACIDLLEHHHIAKAQSSHYKKLLGSMTREKAVVVVDFAENYYFPSLNSDKDVNWSEEYATLHSMHITYLDERLIRQTHKLCVISDYKEHDAMMIYSAIYESMHVIKSFFPFIKTIFYFSDDSSGQYRSKTNIQNLCYHYEDFGISAEWHFFCSGHGKRYCSYISGTLKKRANVAVLQSENANITNANDLYEWSKVNLLDVKVLFVSETRVRELSLKIEDRLNSAGVISGLRSYHAFVPSSTTSLACAVTSSSYEWRSKNFAEASPQPVFEKGTYVSFLFASKWWLGMVDDVTEDRGEYVVLVMQPHGPANNFTFPDHVHKCLVPSDFMLCQVFPKKIGRQYTLPRNEPFSIENCIKEAKKRMSRKVPGV